MALDLVVLAFLGVLAWLGARRGAAESGIRLLGLPLAYGGSLAAGTFAGGVLAERLGTAPWIGAVATGSLGFLAVQGLVELAARGARRRSDEQGLTDVSRLLGSLFGVARGALLLVPLLWLASFAEGARQVAADSKLPDLSAARATRISQAMVAAGASQLADDGDRGDRMTAQVLASPAESVAALNAIVSDPRMRILQADQGFWSDVERGDVSHALARPTFVELARDAEVRARLARLGLIAPGAALDAQQFRDEMAVVMAELGPRLQAIRNDPALDELLADPEVRAHIKNGDTLALLADERVRALALRASQ